jgi:hypothetical protein
MTKSVRKLLIGAALSGFVMGTTAVVSAAPTPGSGLASPAKTKVAKHCCAGKNSCKGQGGCGAEKGKNSCAGKGGCNTISGCKGHPCTEPTK